MIEALNEVGFAWFEYFGLTVLQNTVFLGLVFLALYLLRAASANIKVIVASIGLAKLILPPFLPASVSSTAYESVRVLPQAATTFVLGRTPPAESVEPASIQLDTTALAFVLWVSLGLLYALLAVLSTARLAWRLRGAGELLDEATLAQVRGRGVRVFQSEEIGVPLCFGVLPKKIFVPDAWSGWTPGCRRAVLDHEMAHIERRDGVFQLIQILAQALYFFHPLVWILNRRLREYREMARDDASAGFQPTARIQYSRRLVSIAESISQDPTGCGSASALFERKPELLNRIRYQMNGGIMMSRTRIGISITTLTLLILPLSWYSTDAMPLARSQRPTTASATESGDHKEVMNISITAEGRVGVGDREYSLEDFRDHLEKAAQGKVVDDVVVAMSCGDEVPMGFVKRVQEQFRELGLMKMSYMNTSGKGLNLQLPPIAYKERLAEISDEHISRLTIDGGGMVSLDGAKLDVGQLADQIGKIVDADDKHIFIAGIAEAATYGDFVTFLDLARSAGATRILINQSSE